MVDSDDGDGGRGSFTATSCRRTQVGHCIALLHRHTCSVLLVVVYCVVPSPTQKMEYVIREEARELVEKDAEGNAIQSNSGQVGR